MAAKEVKFGGEARERLLHGVDILAKAATSCSASPTARRASPRMA